MSLLEKKLQELNINEKEYEQIELSKITSADIGKKIKSFGWVENSRATKKITFIDLIAQFRLVECLYEKKVELTKCTSLTIYGTVVECKSSRKLNDFEIHIDEYIIYNDMLAPSFPINVDSSFDSFWKYGHLSLRTNKRRLFLQARSTLLKVIRDIYFENEHIEVTTPTIVQTQVEGGSTLFSLKYYGEDAYLTQSSQLYLETVAPVAYRTYCIMPSYRAEKSNTTRHLSEYTHVEAELANVSFDDLLHNIEVLVSESIKRFYDIMGNKIKEQYPDFDFVKVPTVPFRRIRYSDAIQFLRDNEVLKDDETPFEIGDDIPDSREKILVERLGDGNPIFLTHFLVEHKPFYMKLDPNDSRYTESADLLFPGIGEILGGSMRLDDHESLVKGFEREGIDTKPYSWYLDMARYGPCSHGGYGLGFERLLMAIMKYSNIEYSTLYPRNTRRCKP